MLAFVLPCEVVAEPDVRKASAAVSLADMLLEGVVFSGGVSSGGVRLAEEFAEVEKMGLRARVFSLGEGLPAMYKVNRLTLSLSRPVIIPSSHPKRNADNMSSASWEVKTRAWDNTP